MFSLFVRTEPQYLSWHQPEGLHYTHTSAAPHVSVNILTMTQNRHVRRGKGQVPQLEVTPIFMAFLAQPLLQRPRPFPLENGTVQAFHTFEAKTQLIQLPKSTRRAPSAPHPLCSITECARSWAVPVPAACQEPGEQLTS